MSRETVLRALASARSDAEAIAVELAPHAERMDEQERFAPEVLELLARRDVWGRLHHRSAAGLRPLLSVQCAWVEAFAARCTSTAVLIQSQGTVAHSLALSSSSQARRHLAEMREGALFGWALTEPEAGSDVLGMHTTAHRTRQGYVISGEKRFITNVGLAGHYLLFARTRPERVNDALSAFVIAADAPGLSVTRVERKMGLRGSPTGDLSLAEVFVPSADRVGKEGQGLEIMLNTLRLSRPLIGAVSVGVARAAYQQARDVLANHDEARAIPREQQGVGHLLARIATDVIAARALLYAIAERADLTQTLPPMWHSAAAKSFCSDVAMRAADHACSLAADRAVSQSSPLQRIFRDAKILQIFEGTNEIQRNAIARELPNLAAEIESAFELSLERGGDA
jgi:alkylation response protein AidB-like acyl-CoA dehydrogenase